MSSVDGDAMGGARSVPDPPGAAAARQRWRAPTYPTLPAGTAASDAARGRWLAEQHFVYEVSNDADIILLSMATGGPLVTVVLQPDASSVTGFRVALCRTVDEQHAFYTANRARRHIVDAEVFSSFGGDWYGFVEGVLTHRVLATGELSSTHMCGLLPVSTDEDAIIGEIGFGVPVVDQAAHATVEARRRMRRVLAERTSALQAADLERLAELYAPGATAVERSYPSGEQVVLSGRPSIVAFYRQRLSEWAGPRVEGIVAHSTDWYGFEELLWAGRRRGVAEQFRTGAVFRLSDSDGKIVHQIGYGTPLSTV